MQPPHQHSRIDLAELKAQIVKKLGPEKAKQYFYYLNRFLSVKMSKAEFDKLCFRILGRENILLHNLLIRSILKNASTAKSPPPQKNDILKQSTQVGGEEIKTDTYLANGSHIGVTHTSALQGLSNGGVILPISPRKPRTGMRKSKMSLAPQLPNVPQSSDSNPILQNGYLNHQLLSDPSKISLVRQSSDNSVPLHRNDETEAVSRNLRKDASARVPLQAPLGVPFCLVSIGGAQRALPLESSSRCIGTSTHGALLDSHMLREQMEQIASTHNLEGVSLECANVVNHGLDSYLKRLIRSCVELVGVRSGHELVRNDNDKLMKLVNGVRPGFQNQIQNSGEISLQDFRVAMEMNPRQLGEDWPLLLEKICTRAFEE